MLPLAAHRIDLNARPAKKADPVLEVVMLGHIPGSLDADDALTEIRWKFLAQDLELRSEISAIGFQSSMERLAALLANPTADEKPGDSALKQLYNLPIPIRSLSQFRYLFPAAFLKPTLYGSPLAGTRAWLPLAVQDFFQGGEIGRKLWIIRIEESESHPETAFLPTGADLVEPESCAPFERALLVPRAGIIALPDLERLQIPASLPSQSPALRITESEPRFVPYVFSNSEAQHRFEFQPNITQPNPEPSPFAAIVAPIVKALRKWRPDMQCLLTLPLEWDGSIEQPTASAQSLNEIQFFQQEEKVDPDHHGLFRIQFLFPYLQGPDRLLSSPVGLVAGAQAEISQLQGTWRSAAGIPLPGNSNPYPLISRPIATRLREGDDRSTGSGISVLLSDRGRLILDDERLAGSAVPARTFGSNSGLEQDYHSGEVARFLGWLRRELRDLGDSLVFNVDPRDPRPMMALRSFFGRLYSLGALRGKLPEEAYRIAWRTENENTLIFDIEIAPSFPIDLIRITFLQDRETNTSLPKIEVSHG